MELSTKWPILLICFTLGIDLNLSSQNIQWDLIDLANASEGEMLANGLNLGSQSYRLIGSQNETLQNFPNQCNCLGTNTNNNLYETIDYFPKSTFRDAVLDLAPSVLRFPGGTNSGWYHVYEYDNEWLYDASMAEIDPGNPYYASAYGMDNRESYLINVGVNQLCEVDAAVGHDRNYIETFAEIVKQINANQTSHEKVRVSYVVNLLSHFRFPNLLQCGRNYKTMNPWPDYDCTSTFDLSYSESLFDNKGQYRFELFYKETLDALDFLVNELALSSEDVLYLEMGNEYFFSGGPNTIYGSNEMNVQQYANLVEIYSQRLHCYFDGKVTLQIGVVSEPNTSWQNTSNQSNDNYPGIINLFDQDANGDGLNFSESFDAVILHEYYKSTNCLNEDDISSRFDCGAESLHEYLSEGGELISDLDNLRTNFPGKKIWLTEWNMVNGTTDRVNNYINTMLHSSFVQEGLLSLADYNVQHDNIISFATHHRIGSDNLWSTVQLKDGENDEAFRRASFFPMSYFSELNAYDNYHHLGNLLNTDNFLDHEATITGFYQEADDNHSLDRILLFYTNKTEQGISYALPTSINGLAVKSAKTSYLFGESLFSYGPSNGTKGSNQYTTGSNTQFRDEELNELGYGNIHDQLMSEEDEELSLLSNDLKFIFPYSVGVIILEIGLADNVSSPSLDDSSLTIYPNPSSNILHANIKMQTSQKASLSISNPLGKVVQLSEWQMVEGKQLIKFDISDLTQGSYFLTIQTKEGSVTKPFTKIDK